MESPNTNRPSTSAPESTTNSTPTWTYPTRMCRICREDVAPTVTLYPPGLPPSLQRPVIEYKNDDEYGRLIKPCGCRGGMRYIHEYCLLRSRTEGVRPGSFWKCHECGKEFNFQRLTVQRYLGSKFASGTLTILVMIFIMFILGFVADPIINLYMDPYDTLVGNESYWQEVEINNSGSKLPGWAQHFMKGLVSMGLAGFVKTILLNPLNWLNIRNTGWVSGRSTRAGTTGRERAVNMNWLVILIGVASAFYFFYQWVQSIIGHALQRIGNNVVDTQLPGDDDDLKPPPGYKAPHISPPQTARTTDTSQSTSSAATATGHSEDSDFNHAAAGFEIRNRQGSSVLRDTNRPPTDPMTVRLTDSSIKNSDASREATGETTALNTELRSVLGNAQSQSWSFGNH